MSELNRWLPCSVAVLLIGTAAAAEGTPAAPPAPYCAGEYADDLSVLRAEAREFERQPQGQYALCVRNTAVYECVSYAQDGSLHRSRRKAVAHGTAFAYRRTGGETLLLTNQHVAEWPNVTDEDHPAADVPEGCKRISQSLKIVDNEADAYERDDVSLSNVVSDPALDMAVLKTRAELPVIPWKIGRSAALRERNVVDVRGFPLGAFKATNVGKVVSAYDHDDDKDWDHDDFVIDALLSPGNSGSPVLAVSCKTGEFELVGVYHAGYTGGSALNVVVGIDQLRDLMTTQKRTPREHAEAPELNATARATLAKSTPQHVEPFFPFGSLAATVRTGADGSLFFEVFNKEFPLKVFPILVLQDGPPSGDDAFGTLSRIWFGSRQGLKGYTRPDLDAEAQGQMSRVLEALRQDALAAFAYRVASGAPVVNREDFERVSRLERKLRRQSSSRHDLAQLTMELAERLAPHGAEPGVALTEVFETPANVGVAGVDASAGAAHAAPARPGP